jgi:hypothetical protein
MRYYVLLLIISLAIVPVLHAENSAEYEQKYAILINGILSGHEQVKEKINEAGQMVSTSEHEMIISDGLAAKRMAFSTRMIFEKNSVDPVFYSYQYTEGNTGDSYDVTIKDLKITRILRRGGRTSEVTATVTPETIILDYNVYHQYDYLIRKYDKKKKGAQTFSDFLPIIGLDVSVSLTYQDDSNLKFGDKEVPVKNYHVEFVGIGAMTLSADKSGRMVRLQIPSQGIEVIREDLYSK